MASKYKYEIRYEATYGDWLIGHIYWQVWFEAGKDYKWGDRIGGFAHSKAGAMKKINRAIRKYEKQLPKKFKVEGEL